MRKKFLSVLLTLTMVLAMVPATAMATDVTYEKAAAAKLADHANKIEAEDLYDADSYNVDEKGTTDKTVTITVTGLKEHENAKNVKGYWVGFALAAPDGATKAKYAFSADEITGTDESALNETLSELETDIDGKGANGIAFYINADPAKKAEAKLHAKILWQKDDGTTVGTIQSYTADITGVKIVKDGTAATAVEANVAGDKGASVCDTDSYKVTSGKAGNDDVIPVTIVMTNLEQHENANKKMGYWTGFALVAPAGATQMKYGFEADVAAAETAFKEASLGALETGVDGGKTTEGIAFYINADKAESNTPKLGAVVQWFDEKGNAIGLPAKYLANIDGVTLATTAETIDAVDVTLATPADGSAVASAEATSTNTDVSIATTWKKADDSAAGDNFAAGDYKATIVITAKDKATKDLGDTVAVTYNGTEESVEPADVGGTKTITLVKDVKVTAGPVVLTPIDAVTFTITPPATGEEPDTDPTIAGDAKFIAGEITWDPAITAATENKFAEKTSYKAKVLLTAKDGFKFTDDTTVTVAGSKAVEATLKDGKLEVVVTYEATKAVVKAPVENFATEPVDNVNKPDSTKHDSEKTLAAEVKTEIAKATAEKPIASADELKAGAADTDVEAINTVTEAVVPATVQTNADAKYTAIKAAADDNLETKVLTYVDVQIEDATTVAGGATEESVTLEIQPKYQVVVAIKGQEVKLAGTTGVNDADATAVPAVAGAAGAPKNLKVEAGSPVTVNVPLPASFVGAADKLYAEHTTDGVVYEGDVTEVEGVKVFSFTTTSGFSPYKITKDSPASVEVAGGEGYPTLSAAVGAVAEDGKITLLKNDITKMNVTEEKSFEVAKGTTNFDTSDKVKALFDGGTEYLVTVTDKAGEAGTFVVKFEKYYTVTVNGSYAEDSGADKYIAGTTVTVRAGERSGYKFTGWTTSDVALDHAENVTVEFVMPAKAVTLTAGWEKVSSGSNNGGSGHGGSHSLDEIKGGRYDNLPKEDDKPVIGSDNDPSNPFVDVSTSDPYYDAIMEVYKRGWMVGISDNTFASAGTLTRGMAAQILWNKAGNPAPASVSPFLDVTSDKWYATAIAWAYEQGLVLGYDGTTFGPDDFVTTEQFTIMLDKLAGNTPAPYVGGAANATRGWVANEIVK